MGTLPPPRSWHRTQDGERGMRRLLAIRKKRQAGHRHGRRRRHAEVKGHAPPPPEHLCPPRPADGRCEYCGNDQGPLCLDHDHETGKFRGWLCHPCNLSDVLAGTEGIDIAAAA